LQSAYVDLTNPQLLNLYTLSRGNPESFADLDGHEVLNGTDVAGEDSTSLDACSRNWGCRH